MEKIPLLLLFLSHLWVDASQNILPVVAPKLREVFDLSYFQIGLLMMVLNLTSSVIQPLFGFISDRRSTGWFVAVGLLWTATAMGFLGWSPNFYTALFLVGLSGLGTAAYHPRAYMATFQVSGDRRGFGAAIFGTAGNIGFAIGPLVGSFLVLGYGLHATIYVLIPGVLIFLLVVMYPGDFLKREKAKQGTVKKLSSEPPFPIPWVALITLCTIVALRSWANISFVAYLPMYFETRGIALETGSALLAVYLISAAMAGLYGGHLSDRVGRRLVVIISLLLYTPITALMILSGGWVLWFLVAASGAALLASYSVTVVMAQELLPRHLGLASGLILGLAFGTGGLGSALSGYLADVMGLRAVIWILAIVPVVGVLLTPLLKNPQGDNPV
jgi:FSR family fosmidomycin resistance protein-like MFS transporter